MKGDVVIEYNGNLWVAQLNGTRYADCDKIRLMKRLYKAGAEVVYQDITIKEKSWIEKILSNIKNGVFRKYRRERLGKYGM